MNTLDRTEIKNIQKKKNLPKRMENMMERWKTQMRRIRVQRT